jgi:cytochrome c-type biogenesis protein CcmH/NrfG
LNCAAARKYDKALELDPENLIASYGLAVVLYEMSKHEGRVSGLK